MNHFLFWFQDLSADTSKNEETAFVPAEYKWNKLHLLQEIEIF